MKGKNKVSEIIITVIFAVICLAILAPFIVLVSASLSSDASLAKYGYSILPRTVDLSGYEYVFRNPEKIFTAYKVTIIFSVAATALGTFLMALVAYPLSRTSFRHRGKVSFIFYFTMLFNGGLVPTYILITKYLNLGDSMWVYILPSLISPWYVFMMRTFFRDIPEAICESAVIDGAGEFRIFIQMILPLSKPVLATVALFTFLASWNSWQLSMLYVDRQELYSLQYLLQSIMNNIQLLQQSDSNSAIQAIDPASIPAESARMAMGIVAAGPALLIFPFFQKYFTKGLTVGSVKG